MKSILLSLTVLLLAIPALAQNTDRPVIVATYHQCDASQLPALIERNRERALPIYQAMVDEGKAIFAGEAVHYWGDEYNLVTWLAAPNMPEVLEAYDEMTSRYRTTYPDDRLFIDTCPRHRDNFAYMPTATEGGNPPVGPDNEPTLAISYYVCDYTKLDEMISQATERSQPIAQALVDEGVLENQIYYTHAWGDEWNFIVTRRAADLPTLFTALETMDERYQARYGSGSQALIEQHCTAHKDNIYRMVISTNPASN
jgi:hypothetical protein